MEKLITEEMVESILANDKESFMAAFNAALAAKVNDALEVKKVEVASTLIAPAAEVTVEEEAVVQEMKEKDDEEEDDEEENEEDDEDEKNMKEEVEQIDELKKSTLGSYVNKAASAVAHSARSSGLEHGPGTPGRYNQIQKYENKVDKRRQGISKAVEKLAKEEVEQVDEKAMGNAYAIGMAQAMKSTGDKPPLKKTTIMKAHKIARSVMKKK
jgi:hypothetical protein